jgi:hypothetical protein
VNAVSNIDAVSPILVDLTQRSGGIHSRQYRFDTIMNAAFHGRDVCVGETRNPWDISTNAATNRSDAPPFRA